MSTYIIGDVHGHYATLRALLKRIEYRKKRDTVFLTGDLVNGGPQSAEVIRWARDNARIVLGNHDLHMLAVWYGKKSWRKKDTFEDVFNADDAEELIQWMRQQPLMRIEDNFVVVHAGVYPKWGLKKAARIAAETEMLYQDKKPKRWFDQMYGNKPEVWSDAETDADVFRFGINAFTRMRTVTTADKQFAMNMSFSGSLAQIPEGHSPWFECREKGWPKRIFFGHWAALSLQLTAEIGAMDSGVRWGGPLTAYRVDDGSLFQHPRIRAKK